VTTVVLALGTFAASLVNAPVIAHWDFDDVRGDQVIDISGHEHHGTILGDPTPVEGPFGAAFQFDGIDDYIVVSDHADFDVVDAVTVAMWFRPDADPSGRRLLSKNDAFMVIFDWGDARTIELLLKPDNEVMESTTIDWEIGRWYHFAGTYDGSNLAVYVDGVLEGARDVTTPIASTDLDLWIGADDFGRATDFFAGAIDDVRIYGTALDAADVESLSQGEDIAVRALGNLPVAWADIRRE
jgi:hypothetical protein